MTRLIDWLRQRYSGTSGAGEAAAVPDVALAYRLYWTKMAREWSTERREQVRGSVADVIAQPDFSANLMARRFAVPGLDRSKHAGASLLALQDVLEGLRAFAREEEHG